MSTWQGFIYVAFVIDTFADRIVGWRVSRSAKTDFVLDALEQALYDRRPVQKGGLIHHSDRPSRGLRCKPLPGNGTGNICPFGIPNDWPKLASNRRLAVLVTRMIEPVDAIGSRPLARALAETINGLYKTELVHRKGPWRNMQDLKLATLGWPYGDASIAYQLTGRLVQQPALAGTYRKYSTSRGRRELLCTERRVRYGRVT